MYLLKKLLTSPHIWIGLTLSFLTLHYEGQSDALMVFFNPITYRNLLIGSAIYVAIFDKRYTEHREKFDPKETCIACLETLSAILLVWSISLSLYVSYHESGEIYSETLRTKYAKIQTIKQYTDD